MATKRRGNGTGSFRKRGNSWQLSTMVGYYPDGRRRIKTFTAPTKAQCQQMMRAYLNDMDAGLCVDANYTFAQYSELFMSIHNPDIKPVTQQSYKYTLRLINAYFGSRKISSIKPVDVDLFLLSLREAGRSDSAIAQARGLLYMVLHHAEGNGFIRQNPVRFAKKLRKQKPNEKECYTPKEITLLFMHLPQNRIGWSARLLLGCGIRTQELLALSPYHIAPDGSTITIEQAVSMVRGTATISTPKSFDSYRVVPVPENVRYCAIALRDTDNDYIWSVGDPHKPCNPSTFRKEYRKAIEAVPGVRYLPPHNCRHTYISELINRGVHPELARLNVGHSTLLTTRKYLHPQISAQQEAIAVLSDLFPPPPILDK